ncbi:MAG: DUF1491 family protein [Alphaproteobacteria bacterium]|nr:DUF1491 family protein [Alphaproteobacteria bacterium]
MSERLKAELWVQAQLRLCDIAAVPAMVLRRGEGEAGAILVKLREGGGWTVLAQASGPEGASGWMRGIGPGAMEADAEAYIARHLKRDPDLWVLEIDDPKGQYRLAEKIFS